MSFLAINQIIGGLVSLLCSVTGVIYIKSKAEVNMQTFWDRCTCETHVAHGIYILIQKSTFVFGLSFPGPTGLLILTIINQAAMLSFLLHFIAFAVVKVEPHPRWKATRWRLFSVLALRNHATL
jgi:predicted small integral membrane protein